MMTTLLLLAVVMGLQAQSMNGRWKAGKELMDYFKKEMDKNTNLNILLVFNGNKMDIKIPMEVVDEGIGLMKMSFNIPGTMKKNGKKCTATFNRKNVSLKVDDVISNDPEVRELLQNPNLKKLMFSMVEEKLNEESASAFDDIMKVTELFENFEVISVRGQRMELKLVENLPVSFDKQP
ncbi:MAG: hypothetical protein IKZ62_04095 [Prevotella sp.]|nr:hypothetical protein [Prevotella sp.]